MKTLGISVRTSVILILAVAMFAALLVLVSPVHRAAVQANRPIEFYGKVEDQDGNPISGATVTLTVRRTKELIPGLTSRDVFDNYQENTDGVGRFYLSGATGTLLGIKALERRGYEPAPSSLRKSFWYWQIDAGRTYVPNRNKPELLRMWRQRGAEYLIVRSRSVAASVGRTPLCFDLHSGEVVNSGGDVRVSMQRTPQKIEHGQTHFDWNVSIEIAGGGLIETDAEQPYFAPETGYERKWETRMAANDPAWIAYFTRTFYLRLMDGNYGRMTLECYPGIFEPGVSFHSFVNPRHSRVLEYDSAQSLVPNHVPEPTPSVTAPAGQEPRRP